MKLAWQLNWRSSNTRCRGSNACGRTLSRQTMGVGMRGPGEKQLEVDRRLVERRIHELKLEISKVEAPS